MKNAKAVLVDVFYLVGIVGGTLKDFVYAAGIALSPDAAQKVLMEMGYVKPAPPTQQPAPYSRFENVAPPIGRDPA
jgi:hypothetical protein